MYEVVVLTEALKLSDDAVHKGGLWGNMAPPHWHGVAAVYQKGSSIVHSRVERDPGPGRWSSGAIAVGSLSPDWPIAEIRPASADRGRPTLSGLAPPGIGG